MTVGGPIESTELTTLAPDNPRSLWERAALPAIVCAVGVCNAFWPTLSSGFERMQADAVDTRFNGYLLEYTFRWATAHPAGRGFWSPPFYFPTRGVLAYSDNLLGSAPLYWLLRAFRSPDSAYMLWMILCTILCFAAFWTIARHAAARSTLAAAGAYIFAFGFWRCRLINHQQLLPQFLTPLAVWELWAWTQRPSLRRWTALLALLYLQTLCGIYLGWFLAISLAPFAAIVLLLQPSARRQAAQFLSQRWLACTAITAGFLLLAVATFWPYLQLERGGASFGWMQVHASLPTLHSWLPPWRSIDPQEVTTSAAAGDLSTTVHPLLPLQGWLFCTLLLIGCAAMIRAPRHPAASLGLGAAAVGIILILLSTRFGPAGVSAWQWIYRWIPGATAIRAVDRIALIAQFYLALSLILGLEILLRSFPARWRSRAAALLAAALIAEQWVAALPSFEIAPLQHQTAELAALMRGAPGDAAYVADYTAPGGFDYAAMQLTAMNAGLAANVPVINGYSAAAPPGYRGSGRPILPGEMRLWLSDAPPSLRRLTVIAPAPPGLPIDWAQQFPLIAVQRSPHLLAQTFAVPGPASSQAR